MKRMLGVCVALLVVCSASPAVMAQSISTTTIEIASIGVSAEVVPVYLQATSSRNATWDVSGLRMNAGLLTGLGVFGEQGNTVVGAHSEAFDGTADLFYNLDTVQIGSHIVINVNGQLLTYEVQDVYSVAATDLTPVYPTQDERLTLITCDRDSYSSESGRYSQRVIVVAHRVS
jgi:LPXTG-site transpeptidase (sortase) family protein